MTDAAVPVLSQDGKPPPQGASKRWSLRAYLLALALALLLPALLAGAGAVLQAVRGYQSTFLLRLEDTARALALALDAELGAQASLLSVLSVTPSLDGRPPGSALPAADNLARAARSAGAIGSPLVVIGPDLRQLMHTGYPPDADLPPTASPAAARAVLETGRARIADLVTHPASGGPVIPIMVPILRGGEVTGILAAQFAPRSGCRASSWPRASPTTPSRR